MTILAFPPRDAPRGQCRLRHSAAWAGRGGERGGNAIGQATPPRGLDLRREGAYDGLPARSPRMSEETIDDLPEIREELQKHWQKAGLDLVRRGFRPEAVFETMLTVGLAGFVEVHGKDAVAERLVMMAQRLSEQIREERQATAEAARATKN